MGIINPRMLVPPVLVYFIRNNLDLTDPETITWIRLTYGVAQAVMLTVLCYITVRVLLNPKRGLAIKVKTQPQPMSMETEPTIEEMTLRDYELSLVKKECIQFVMSVAIGFGLMHLYWGHVTSLSKPLFKVYVIGTDPEGTIYETFAKGPLRNVEAPETPMQLWLKNYQAKVADMQAELSGEPKEVDPKQAKKAARKAEKSKGVTGKKAKAVKRE